MKKIFLFLVIVFSNVAITISQTFSTYKFDQNGKIEIPSDFKNADLAANSSKIVVIKANGNIDGYNFYIKFSYMTMDKSYTQTELRNNKEMIFENLTQEFNKTKNDLPKIGATLLKSFPNETIEIDKAIGGKFSYDYTNPKTGERTTVIYQLYYQNKMYFLTMAWSKEINDKSILLSKKIISSIKF